MTRIIQFYGEKCPFCIAIEEAVERLVLENGIDVERLEVWNNEDNKKRMEEIRSLYEAECGGNMIVPSFYDPASDRLICNPESYETLRDWAMNTT
jgi:thiol-disulfide isomerase/thioredoxin